MKKLVLLIMATILLVGNMTLAEWSTPILLDELNDPVTGNIANSPCLSSDELTMYFSRYNTDGIVQIVEAYRENPVGQFTSERIISELYTNRSGVANPWISEDGLRLYYNRWFGNSTLILIRMATRENISDPWTPVINFTDIHVNGSNDKWQSLTGDELTMFYVSTRTGIRAVWMTTRESIDEQFSNPVFVCELNDNEDVSGAYVLSDGLTIYFSALRDGNPTWDIYRASRSSTDEPFDNIELVDISTDIYHEFDPFVTPDEKILYFNTPEGIFVSDWIENPYNDAVKNILDTIDDKKAAIKIINDNINKENDALIALDELLESGELGDLKPQDIHQAKQQIKQAIQRQIHIRKELRKSIWSLRKALRKLKYEFS